VCKIVETEAYGGITDTSSHAHRFHNARMRTVSNATPSSVRKPIYSQAELCPIKYPYVTSEETSPPMSGPVGRAYVYLIYGHKNINVVSHLPGEIGGVLIRSIAAECEIRGWYEHSEK